MARILITGVSSGIGKATAAVLGEYYHITGIDTAPAPKFGSSAFPAQQRLLDDFYQVDVRNLANLPRLDYPVHYIVCSAGTDNAADALDVNVGGVINTLYRYLSRETLGVVLVSSLSAHTGIENAPYVASKAAILGLTKHYAIKMAEWGGRCNCVSPGAIETPMNTEILERDELRWAVAEQNHLRRWGTATEVAKMIEFLLFNATFTTGEDFKIDGGESWRTKEIKAPNAKVEDMFGVAIGNLGGASMHAPV